MDYVAAATNNLGYVRDGREAACRSRCRGARGTSARCSPSCSGSPATSSGSAATRWTSARVTVFLYVPARAGAGARPVRGVLRRAAHLQLDAHRRPAARHPAGLGQEGAASSATCMMQKLAEYETLLTHNRIWLERTRGIGVISGRRRDRRRPVRAAAARLGRAARRAEGRAVRGLRRDASSTCRSARRRHLRPVPGAARGVPAVGADHPAGDRGHARGADHRQGAAADQAAGRRDLPRERGAEGRDRLLHRQRRQVDAARTGSACGRRRSATCRRCRSWCAGTWWPTSSRSSARSTSCWGKWIGKPSRTATDRLMIDRHRPAAEDRLRAHRRAAWR